MPEPNTSVLELSHSDQDYDGDGDPFSYASSFLASSKSMKQKKDNNSNSSNHQQLSRVRLADLIGRAKLGDIEGVVAETQLSNKDALRFARSLSSSSSSYSSFNILKQQIPSSRTAGRRTTTTTRQLLRTPDARKLLFLLLRTGTGDARQGQVSSSLLFHSATSQLLDWRARVFECHNNDKKYLARKRSKRRVK